MYILDPSENLTKVIILRERVRAVFQALSILISKLLEDKNKQVFKIILDRRQTKLLSFPKYYFPCEE